MSRLISIATGNFTAAGTWGLVDDTSYLDSESTSQTVTTSFVYSSTFTPGAITVDGVAIKIANRTGSTGTLSVELNNHTDTLVVATTTIDVADVAGTLIGTTFNHGWYYFKFSAPQLLLAGKAYKVGVKTSAGAQINLYRDATTNNWSRMLRTTTTQAPAANDQLHIIGEHTGQGTGNSFTVTMNNTATTSFGPTVSGGPPQGITVGKRGTLTCGVAAATAYYLKWKGVFAVYDGSTLNIGTSVAQIPSDSTAVFEMDSVTNVDTGFDWGTGATVNVWGATKQNVWTLLNTDEAAGATVLGVASTTGWAANDEIAIASTTRTAVESEKRTILTVDSAVQVTVTAGLTNAHSGTSPTQAEVINLTQNVKLRGISAALNGYINIAATAIITLRYLEFYNLGSVTALKRGIDVATTTGTFDLQYFSLHDFTNSGPAIGINVTSASGNNIQIQHGVTYNCHSTHYISVGTTGVQVWNDLVMMMQVSTAARMSQWADAGSTYTDIRAISCMATSNSGSLAGIYIVEAGPQPLGVVGIISGLTAHSNQGTGIYFQASWGVVNGMTTWRNAVAGSSTFGLYVLNSYQLTVNGIVSFGNSNPPFADACSFVTLTGDFNGDTTFASTYGLRINNSGPVFLENCTFGVVTGIKTAHTTSDIVFISGPVLVFARNCLFASATETTGAIARTHWLLSQKHDQTAGLHKAYSLEGTIVTDTVLFRSASPSMRLTPSVATRKLTHGPEGCGFFATVANGATCEVSVYVRKSVAGDGTAYNGAQPRLIVRKNVAAGIAADTVIDTATAASDGAWEELTGTTGAVTDDCTLEFIVDCDGTTGWVNVDDFSTTTVNDSGGLKFWSDGLPLAFNDNSAGGGGSSEHSHVFVG